MNFYLNRSAIIVFLDINMPEMSGWELIDELKSHFNIIKEYMTFILFPFYRFN